jgi:tRNA dimethylallyltransferase
MTADAVLIAGPTAGGKTMAALAIAEAIGGAIVNADSMAVYRELRVLTARPSDAEMASVPHYLFGHVSVHDHYSVGRYQNDAARALAEVWRLKRTPIFVGGTGLYFSALTDGISDMPQIPARVREAMRARLAKIGHEAFHAELATRDPQVADQLRPSDTQRLLRAAEILETTGSSLVVWQKNRGRAVLEGMRLAKFVLEVPRKELRDRIEKRFRAMLASGAREEAAALAELDRRLPAAKALGLRELAKASKEEASENGAISRAITKSRQFAKRQETWFRHKMADWPRIPAGQGSNFIAEILTRVT